MADKIATPAAMRAALSAPAEAASPDPADVAAHSSAPEVDHATSINRAASTNHGGEPASTDTPERTEAIARLLNVMAALRDPETGCAWDREQTFASIAPYTIEEAYEVADAIARNDMADLKDELGDLLLQVVYHAQMAAEQGAFDFHDVANAIVAKMIRRHPHVFGERRDTDTSPALRWEEIKRQERADKLAHSGQLAKEPQIFSDIPANLPALQHSIKLQKRAARLGFDWRELPPLLAKVDEEWSELRAEVDRKAANPGAETRITEEFGDLLFVLANLGLHLGVDAESALRAANAKFIRRMRQMERFAAESERKLEALSLDEMEQLWQRAKSLETAPTPDEGK
jgi:MazG family protein